MHSLLYNASSNHGTLQTLKLEFLNFGVIAVGPLQFSAGLLCADVNGVNLAFLTTTTNRKNKYATDMFKSRFLKIDLTKNV